MGKIRVLIADDHKIVRDGLKVLLSDVGDIEVVAEAATGDEVIGWLDSIEADVVIMDVNMPRRNGIETTEVIGKQYPKTRVVALSMFNEDGYIRKMLNAGALSYLLKDCGKTELVTAIRKVIKGESYFPENVSKIVMSRFMTNKTNQATATFPAEVKLTKREKEILTLIAQENTNREISEKLFISQRTVDTHRRSLIQKLCVKNTAGLVRYAVMHDYV